MNLPARIDSLKQKHHVLENAIESANSRPYPDDTEVALLKKEKLLIKDKIVGLAQH